MNPEPASAAASSTAAAIGHVFPSSWPELNTLAMFGLLLALGVLGGLVAARARWLPSITGFMMLGLLVGPSGLGLLTPNALAGSSVLVDIALGLILFRLGVTLHPVKAMRDRRLLVTSLVESLGTFLAILLLMLWIGAEPVLAVLAAAIAVSSSPAVLIHVAEELNASGPTVQHAESLVAANNVLSFVLFSLALPMALVGDAFELKTAVLLPAYQFAGAVVVALLVAWLVTSIARLTRHGEEHFRFALVVGAVMLTLGLAQGFKVSSLFASLALGIACRTMQGRTRLTRVDFGGGGDVFFVILFVFAGANLHLAEMIKYAPIALAFVAVRMLVKVGSVYGVGIGFGTPHRASAAAGLMLVPMAGLAIGLVQTTSLLMPELGGRVAAIVLAAVAIFETIGPPLVTYALHLCGEANPPAGQDGAAPATSLPPDQGTSLPAEAPGAAGAPPGR
jgi:Kef-type K+ transport system membrane component KefB